MKSVLNYLLALYRTEPVRVNAAIVNLTVIAAAYFDVVIDPDSVWQILAIVGAITGVAEMTRRKVTPAN